MYKKYLFAVLLLGAASPAFAQDWRTITSLRQFRNEQQLEVSVEYGAGNLTIAPSTGNSLYKATLRYDADAFKPVTQYSGGRLRVGVEGGSIKGRNMKAGRLDLTLGNRVPLDMDLKFGAVRANVELGGLRIRQLHVATGASETDLNVSSLNPERCSTIDFEVGAAEFTATGLGNLNCEHIKMAGGVGDVTLDFNGAWRVDASVDIGMGLGSLTLRVPRGLGVAVTKKGVLASFDSQELIKRGNTFYSDNWDKASNRVTFTIDAALGSIRMVWVEPEAEFRKAQR
ncbi:MAG TPA: toast rack family protein [Longimicrobiales bacterium]